MSKCGIFRFYQGNTRNQQNKIILHLINTNNNCITDANQMLQFISFHLNFSEFQVTHYLYLHYHCQSEYQNVAGDKSTQKYQGT